MHTQNLYKDNSPEMSPFLNSASFDHAQRVAKALSSSDMIPKAFSGNIANILLAMEMAARLGLSPLMVMQNMHIISGKPCFSSAFIIATLNRCGRFSSLHYEMSGEESSDNYGCRVWCSELSTGEKLEGPIITIAMAKAEGWYNKPGSKWKTLPEQMLRYRAAAFFSRIYAPEAFLGLHSIEEMQDVIERKAQAAASSAQDQKSKQALEFERYAMQERGQAMENQNAQTQHKEPLSE